MSSSTLPSTMRAWSYSRRGPPRNVLTLSSSYPTPDPPTGSNIIIRVSHAGVNPDGTLIMTSIPFIFGRATIPELDFSGVVHSVGPSAPPHLVPGTRVFGSISLLDILLHCKGTMAEYVSVGCDAVTRMPDGLGFAEAAGLNGVGQTARKLVRTAGIEAGMKVLVNGASGGVGTMAVQLAKAKGAHVVATCSGRNMEMVSSLGADKVIDYQVNQPLHEYLAKEHKGKPFDAILDTTGTQTLYDHSPAYLKVEGLCVNVGAFEGTVKTLYNWCKNSWLPVVFGGIPRRYIMFNTFPDPKVAGELARMTSEGKLKVMIDSVFAMEDALQAYDKIVSHRARGKLIVKIRDVC